MHGRDHGSGQHAFFVFPPKKKITTPLEPPTSVKTAATLREAAARRLEFFWSILSGRAVDRRTATITTDCIVDESGTRQSRCGWWCINCTIRATTHDEACPLLGYTNVQSTVSSNEATG